METHRYLAIRHFPQGATVLPRHSHRVRPGLWKGRLINNPNLCLTEQIDHLAGQTLLYFLHGPGTLAHELPQGLHVSAGDARRQRLYRLALPVQQQALNINLRPVASLATPHGFQQVFEKMHQATIEASQALRCHASTLAQGILAIKYYLT